LKKTPGTPSYLFSLKVLPTSFESTKKVDVQKKDLDVEKCTFSGFSGDYKKEKSKLPILYNIIKSVDGGGCFCRMILCNRKLYSLLHKIGCTPCNNPILKRENNPHILLIL